jgi:ADP-heptose:LPS heptosyltransferase
MQNPDAIIISRTDNIGDVVLTLPVCGILKEKYPHSKIIFIGRRYTQPVVECCVHVDEFMDWDEMQRMSTTEQASIIRKQNADAIVHVFPNHKIAVAACKAGVPLRIGTSHRLFHWLTCNKLLNVNRKNSNLHEAQLNMKLLLPLGITRIPTLDEIQRYFGFYRIKPLPADFASLIDPNKFNLILHPKSRGSAREWGVSKFLELIKILPADKFKIFITGTQEEGVMLEDLFMTYPYVTNLCGKLSLENLISFISHCDGLVAASTGPLHIASVMGKKTIGIFSPLRPIHPGRWAPLGKNAKYLVKDISCNSCRKNNDCQCIREITPEQVMKLLI